MEVRVDGICFVAVCCPDHVVEIVIVALAMNHWLLFG